MTTHILTIKNTSTCYKIPGKPTLHFASTEHYINGDLLVAYIKGDPCTYFETDEDLYTAAYNWSQTSGECHDGDYIAMNGERLFYMNDFHLERVPGSLKPDYYLANIMNNKEYPLSAIMDNTKDHLVIKLIIVMKSCHTLGTLRELGKTPNINEKVADCHRQVACDQYEYS